jgi:hypothetical protein
LLNDWPHRLDFFKFKVLVILLVKHQEDVERFLPIHRLVQLRLVKLVQQLDTFIDVIINLLTALAFKGADVFRILRLETRLI